MLWAIPRFSVRVRLIELIVADGLCAIDVELKQPAASAYASLLDVANAAASMMRLCVKGNNPPVGGIVSNVGELLLRRREYDIELTASRKKY